MTKSIAHLNYGQVQKAKKKKVNIPKDGYPFFGGWGVTLRKVSSPIIIF